MSRKLRDIGYLCILLAVLVGAMVCQAEIIVESGSLLEFFAGTEDGCAYDNWVSHISEAIAREGYNDYEPVELDRQTNGFGTYTVIDSLDNPDLYLTSWYRILAQVVGGDLNIASEMLDTSVIANIYDIVLLEDGEDHYVILREVLNDEYFDDNGTEDLSDDVRGSFDYGWGVYIFNLQSETPNIIIEAPHPCDDFITTYIGIDAFLQLGAYAIFVSGAGREVKWIEDGDFDNSLTLSDPTRNARTFFQEAHKCVVDLIDNEYVMQLHSYDTGNRNLMPVLLSTYPDNYPNAPLYDAETNLDILNLTPLVPILANSIGGVEHDSVRVDSYYAIWNSGDSIYYHREYPISRTMTDLQGWDSPQRHYSLDHREGGTAENWLHIEHDELPNVINEGMLDYYPVGGVPTYATYRNAIEFNRPLYAAIYTYFHTRRLHHIPQDFETIQAGIDAGYGGDTIVVHPGEYVENINFNGKNLLLTSLYISGNDPAYIDATVIDGGGGGSIITFENKENNRARLSGFTLRNGWAVDGGGIYCSGADPSVDHCLIEANFADDNGGAVFCESGGITLTNCTITENSANDGGGALYCWDGAKINLVNSILWANEPQEIFILERGEPDTIVFSYCDMIGGEEGIVNRQNALVLWDDGSIVGNPAFIDPEAGNYHLLANSPCIDTGNPASFPDPDSSRVDMGAFSFFHRNLVVSPWLLEFGNVRVGDVDSLSLRISNRGDESIRLTDIVLTPDAAPFSIATDVRNVEIEPGGDQVVFVKYEPVEDGVFDAMLRIESDEQDQAALNVALRGGQMRVNPGDDFQPKDFEIISFYPNPFNSSGLLVYYLQAISKVEIALFNISGQKIRSLLSRTLPGGIHTQTISSSHLATGLYFAQVRAGDMVLTKRVLVCK